MSTITERFDWMVRFLIVRWKFVHQILGMLEKAADETIGTMGVAVISSTMHLRYCVAFVNDLTDPELVYVFYHEILHLVLHHCTHRKFSDKELGGIACDLAVNELIPHEPGSCKPDRKSVV